MSRLFVALWPPPHVVAALEGLHRKDERDARFVPPENWHVTLHFLGEAHAGEVAAALDSVPSDALAATTVRIGPAVDVGDGRTLFVPVAGTDDLASVVVEATRGLGTEAVRRRFLGHITIARIKRRRGRPVTMPRALGTLIDESWEPTEIALVESTLHPEGARYQTLQTWPIQAGA